MLTPRIQPKTALNDTIAAVTQREEVQRTALESSVYFLAKIISASVSFTMLPVMARLFAPAEFGVLSLALTFASIGTILVSDWIITATGRFLPAYEKEGRVAEFYTTLRCAVALSLVALIALGIPTYYLMRASLSAALRATMVPVGLLIVMQGIFAVLQGLQRMRRQARAYMLFDVTRTVGSALCGVALVLALGYGISGMLWGAILCTAIAAVCLYGKLRLPTQQVERGRISEGVKSLAWYGVPLVSTTVCAWILGVADRYVIEAYRGSAEVGLYSMGYNLADRSINLLKSSFLMAVTPAVVIAWERAGRVATESLLEQLTRFFILITVPAAVGLSLLAYPLLTWLTTPDYASSWPVMPFVVTGSLLHGLSLLSYLGLAIAKKSGRMVFNYLVAGAVNMGLNLLLVPQFGYIAAAVTTTLGFATLFVLNSSSASQYLTWRVNGRSATNVALASGSMAVVLVWLQRIIHRPMWVCLLGVVMGGVTYLVALYIMREFSLKDIRGIKQEVLTRLGARKGQPAGAIDISIEGPQP